MEHYTENNDYWKIGKVLKFFANFINNCREKTDYDNVFTPVADLVSPENFLKLVKASFPPNTISRMQKQSTCIFVC